MDSALERLRVDIFGTEYMLRGQASIDHLRAVAVLVDGVMKQVASANPHMEQKKIAVLAAVNIADELYRLQVAHRDLLAMLDDTAKSEPSRG